MSEWLRIIFAGISLMLLTINCITGDREEAKYWLIVTLLFVLTA